MKAVFINSDASRPRDALYQAGLVYGEAFRLCKSIDVTCINVSSQQTKPLPSPRDYDVAIFNYQHVTQAMLPMEYFRAFKRNIGFLYEARLEPELSPTHIQNVTCGTLFDDIVVPDPTVVNIDDHIWGAPRVIPRVKVAPSNHIPFHVGTFGFPSPWKDLESVVKMLNEEFTLAVFRLNFAMNDYQEGTGLHQYMMERCAGLRALAKPGIEIRITHDYMDQDVLVNWLAEHDVNVFLASAERGEITGGALLASADVAIAAQKSIMVSATSETRHLKPLRHVSLKDASKGDAMVHSLYREWSPENFARRIDNTIGVTF